ncbi:hypothetical protein QJQ45_025138 [Haematococcus lacustris]|nr:hypothetical protein QJQ45_025138 [Haematococcus lacustris]
MALMAAVKRGTGSRSAAQLRTLAGGFGILAIAAVMFCWSATAVNAASGGTTLDPTVLILGEFDWEPYQQQPPFTSRCVDMAWRGADLGTRRIQFVPTHYWNQDAAGNVRGYCYFDGSGTCNKFTKAALKKYEDGLALCFGAALDAGFTTFAITPHIDNGDNEEWSLRTWRNGLVFDPRQRYGGISYEEIMLQPLARALARYESDPRLKRVHFALQGEMGATVMRYPTQYLNMISGLGNIISNGPAPPSPTSAPIPAEAPRPRANAGSTGFFANGGGGGGFLFNPLAINRILGQQQAATEDGELGTLTSTPITGKASTTTLPAAPPTTPNTTTPAAGQIARQPLINSQGQAAGDTATALAQQQSTPSVRKTPNGVRVEFGLTFNFVYSDGSQGGTNTALGALNVGLTGWVIGSRPGFGAPAFNAGEVERLFRAMDFIGISAYAPQTTDFQPNQLQASAFNMLDSFESVGVDLKGIIQQTGAALHYVEYGLGGGTSQSGSGIAASPAAAINKPFWGVVGAYERNTDPWQREYLRTFMHTFWQRTLTWLAQGGGPTYKVEACYAWCKASWDVLGIYPESTSSSGSFRDETVVGMIRAHNKAISGGRR